MSFLPNVVLNLKINCFLLLVVGKLYKEEVQIMIISLNSINYKIRITYNCKRTQLFKILNLNFQF